jgi:cell division transport system permease protein
MYLVPLYRVIKFAAVNFWRNIWLAIVTTTIMSMCLFVVMMLFGLNLVINQAIHTLHEQVDVSVYFKPEITPEVVQEFQTSLQQIPGVREVVYISKDSALENFKQKFSDNPVILESLTELAENPLGDTLIIQAESIDDYDLVLQVLNNEELTPYIQEKNFQDYNTIITKISDISSTVNRIGLFLSIIFLLIAILVTFNTIRIAIYTYRSELGIMRLVGASKAFIEWPFFVEGFFYALIAVFITTAAIYPIASAVQPFLDKFFGPSTLNLIKYLNASFIKIVGLQLLAAVVISIFSSWLAVRKYIKN